MDAAEYDGWYDTPRGHWIGDREYQLLLRQLAPRPGGRLLDVGCGTGWFTRRLALQAGLDVTGIDIDARSLEFARNHDTRANYLLGDACHLPFGDDSFNEVVSIMALCFIPDWTLAMREIVRVCRNRFAIGLLNRYSLKYSPSAWANRQFCTPVWPGRREIIGRGISCCPCRAPESS